ncbi:MAG: FAD-dependent oxidoreductase [Acutalibacteraceae bacterium]|nr:FAD-dependent oxidoreductase [Acutalibacteraceae bacterium]
MIKHDIVIIGGGPAGMAAAVAAYDNGVRDVVIIDREEKLGGILKQCIHNGFGLHKLGKELTGPEYAAHYEKAVSERGIKVFYETMVTDISADRIVTAQSTEGILKIKAKAVVLAMGCRERSRGALNIPGTRPAGVYSAGTAQKLINCMGYSVGKRVVILGSGDIGLIMARRMSLQGAKVEAVCEIMPYSGGLTRNIVQCLEDFGIPLYLSTTVAEIHGKERVEGVTIAQVDENRRVIEETKRYIPCDTLLLSCGLIPENELTSSAEIPLSRVTSGALVDEHRQTEREGIFACGNVLQVHDLVDYVSDEAEIAGKSAAEYVKGNLNTEKTVKTAAGNGVRYVLPQRVTASPKEDISLFLRVTEPFGKVKYTVKSGDEVLATAVRLKAAPGEMEKITVKAEKLNNITEEITVSLEEVQ